MIAWSGYLEKKPLRFEVEAVVQTASAGRHWRSTDVLNQAAKRACNADLVSSSAWGKW